MKCKEQHIREQLPSYLEGKLEHGKTALVELHLARCADCAEELTLLRLLANDPSPDPGEAFWASLPDRVYREVRQQCRDADTFTTATEAARAAAGAAAAWVGAAMAAEAAEAAARAASREAREAIFHTAVKIWLEAAV